MTPSKKKPLYHFYPGTRIFSLGTIGCNLGCQFCQNWNISHPKNSDQLIQQADPDQIVRSAIRAQCPSVALTYNDPIVFAEYAMEIARQCHSQNIKTVAITAGYINAQPRKELFDHIDAVNVDLKAFTESFYQKFCLAHLKPVLETLIDIKKNTKAWLEITTLLIPEENDSDQEVRDLCRWILDHLGADVPIHFSAFFPAFKLLDRNPTPKESLTRARTIAQESGIAYAYTGNIIDVVGSTTFCQGCGQAIIERDGYELTHYHLKENRCAYCDSVIPGHFVS